MAKPILNNPIVKNLSILVSGTVLAQLIVIGFQLILRRLYSPEDFGAFAVYMSLMGIIVTIASLRYEQAILLPKEPNKAFAVFFLSLGILGVTILFLLVLVLVFKNSLANLIHLDASYSWWLYLLPVSVALFGLTQALNLYLIRQKEFAFSASNKAWRRLSEGAIQSILGLLSKPLGLIWGDWMGHVVIAIRTFFKLKKGEKINVSRTLVKEVAKQYRDFPIKNGIPSVLNALSLLLPVLIINRKFSVEETGYFDLARMVLIIPLSLVTASLSQVLLQRFAEKRNAEKRIGGESLKTFFVLLAVALVFGLVIQFFGAPLFQWVFGSEWQVSGQFASILVWAFALKFVVSPFNIVFTAFEKIGWLSVWQVVYFLLIIALNWLPVASMESFLRNYLFIELISYLLVGLMDIGIIFNYDRYIKGMELNK